MPDRHLRESAWAFEGRMGALEAKQRAASTRVWPGAMRTGRIDSYTPVDPTAWNTMVNVVALPGRWLVLAQFNLSCDDPGGDVDFEFRLAAFNNESGTFMEPDGDTVDLPTYYYSSAESTAIVFPVTLMGDITHEEDFNLDVSVQAREANDCDWTASAIRLKLIPR